MNFMKEPKKRAFFLLNTLIFYKNNLSLRTDSMSCNQQSQTDHSQYSYQTNN